MQNRLYPARLHFPTSSLMGGCDMVMIATHDCVCMCVRVVWSNPDSDTVVRRNIQTQLTIMQW